MDTMELLPTSAAVFDLETIADKSVIKKLPPIEDTVKLGNLKDPVKIEEKIKQAKEDRIKNLGLNPWTGRICCIGIAETDATKTEIKLSGRMLEKETDKAEKYLLERIWDRFLAYDKYITFNGTSFDVPYLYARSIRLGVKPSVRISTAKYKVTNHIDVRSIFTNFEKYESGNLDFFCKVLLNENKSDDGMDGSKVQGLWDSGEHDKILSYCKDDVHKTYKLAQKIYNYGVL